MLVSCVLSVADINSMPRQKAVHVIDTTFTKVARRFQIIISLMYSEVTSTDLSCRYLSSASCAPDTSDQSLSQALSSCVDPFDMFKP